MAKKTIKKGKSVEACCSEGSFCYCKGFLAVLIVVLIWVAEATWSKVVITLAAILILLSSGSCICKKPKK